MKHSNIFIIFVTILISSCSILGIQNEESPSYKVIQKKGNLEIREYSTYIVAQTTVSGDFNESSSKGFKILAGYIFGKNKAQKEVAMTSPVEIKKNSKKIAMTSPVTINQKDGTYTMHFSMPSNYTMENLPEPLDKRVQFKKINSKIVASHQFSWFSSQKKNDKKASELRAWLDTLKKYKAHESYSYAGYNPPWTLPFFRRNEVHIEVKNINK